MARSIAPVASLASTDRPSRVLDVLLPGEPTAARRENGKRREHDSPLEETVVMDPIGALDRLGYLGRRRADVVGLLADGLGDRLAAESRVLDFGAGSGRVSIALAEKVPLRYTLVDTDREALASAPAGWTTAVLEPGRPLPFESGHFQAAFAVDVLHHVPEALASLTELRRVLVPGGWLWIVEYDLRRWMVRLMGLVCRLRRMQRHLLAPAELDRLLGEAGFEGSVSRLDALRVLAVARA